MEKDLLQLINNHKIIDVMWYDEKTPLPEGYVALFIPKTVHNIPKHLGLSIYEVDPRLHQEIELDHPHFIPENGMFIEAQIILLKHFYPIDWEKKKLVGITGTNGKTTTCELARQMLEQLGIPAFSMGSLGLIIGDKTIPIPHNLTTPPLIELHKLLHQAYLSTDIGFMEVSAHGIDQQRIYKIPFACGGWTSFSQDHLDYFNTMDNYFQSKVHFVKNVSKINNKAFFISTRQAELIKALSNFPIRATDGKIFALNKKRPAFLHIPYNLENFDVAINCIEYLLEKEVLHLIHFDQIKAPAGRFSVIELNKKTIVIDSAHTPDALENVLKACSFAFPHHDIHLVMGCGGDRDSKKRPLMGKIAENLAKRVYLTSDNPRHEDPQHIIDGIKEGMKLEPYYSNVDRKMAIIKGLNELDKSKSILVITGKGPEEFQYIKDEKIPFNDEQVVREYLK